jgi:hypothetical protein
MTPDTSQPKVVSPRPEGSNGTEAQLRCGPAAPAADFVMVPREANDAMLMLLSNGEFGSGALHQDYKFLMQKRWAELLAATPTPPAASEGATFQARVHPWMLECFGEAIAADPLSR